MGWFDNPTSDTPPEVDTGDPVGGLPITMPILLQGYPHHRFNPFAAHSFTQIRLPDPGAPGWVYDLWGQPEFSPIGYGIANKRQLQATQPPVTVALHGVWKSGIGGLQAGQILQSPLTLAGYSPSQGASVSGMSAV